MENNTPICPMLSTSAYMDGNEMKCSVLCQKEGCALWVEDKQKCAVVVLATKK